ncbi:MAG: hypothetical protein ABIT83_20190 [Massilia sp.]
MADHHKAAIEGALKYAVERDLSHLNLSFCDEHDRRLLMFVSSLATHLTAHDPDLAARIDAMFHPHQVGK